MILRCWWLNVGPCLGVAQLWFRTWDTQAWVEDIERGHGRPSKRMHWSWIGSPGWNVMLWVIDLLVWIKETLLLTLTEQSLKKKAICHTGYSLNHISVRTSRYFFSFFLSVPKPEKKGGFLNHSCNKQHSCRVSVFNNVLQEQEGLYMCACHIFYLVISFGNNLTNNSIDQMGPITPIS